MKNYHNKNRTGFTLVECMVMTLVLMISMGGLIGFRYHSVLSAERAESRLLAARAAQVLAETWKGLKGDTGFAPEEFGFDTDFQVFSGGVMEMHYGPLSEEVKGAVLLGHYLVVSQGRQFQAVLAYQDDAMAGDSRVLYVTLNWTDRKGLARRYEFSTVSQTVI